MMKRAILAIIASATLAGCVVPPPASEPGGRPLEVLPADVALANVEADLLATARERFGAAMLDRALAAPIHLIAKRFVGLAPPPPPGASGDWPPPTPAALLYKERGTWMAATETGWRQVRPAVSDALDTMLGDRALWNESATIQSCPDYGANLLLLKGPEGARIVRNHQCASETSRLVDQALQAAD